MPSPDAKPEYHNAICTVANIDPQQSMYYQACPDNNRKVIHCNACAQWCLLADAGYMTASRYQIGDLECLLLSYSYLQLSCLDCLSVRKAAFKLCHCPFLSK